MELCILMANFTRTPPPSWTLKLPRALLNFTDPSAQSFFSLLCRSPTAWLYLYMLHSCKCSPRAPSRPQHSPSLSTECSWWAPILYSPCSCVPFGLLFLFQLMSLQICPLEIPHGSSPLLSSLPDCLCFVCFSLLIFSTFSRDLG